MVKIQDNLILSEPSSLQAEALDILGVSSPLQRLWSKHPYCPSKHLKLWYKSPLLGNPNSWLTFSLLNKLSKVPSTDLLFDPFRGGITLVSKPKPLEGTNLLHPNFGISWELLQLNGSGETAWEGTGIFQVNPKNELDNQIILSKINGEWMISGVITPHREGSIYPIKEIELQVCELPHIHSCMVVPDRDPNDFINHIFTIIAFVTPQQQTSLHLNKEGWEVSLRKTIEEKIGRAFLPDRVLFYPMYPSRLNGELNREWVLAQYKGGLLPKKHQNPLYHQLNMLRQAIYSKQL